MYDSSDAEWSEESTSDYWKRVEENVIKKLGLSPRMAMDGRWITIGARKKGEEGEDDEGRKGRHIYLENGETPEEAINELKDDEKENNKKQIKEVDGEKENKKEESPDNKEKSKEEKTDKKLEDMTDEELEEKRTQLDNEYRDFMQRRKDALAQAKKEDKELSELQKEYDELYEKMLKTDYYTNEGHELYRKRDEVNDKINKREDDIFDMVSEKFAKEDKEISGRIYPIQQELYRREQEREEVSLKKRDDFMSEISSVVDSAKEDSYDMFEKKIKDLEEKINKSDMNDNDKRIARDRLADKSGDVLFSKKADYMGGKIKEYRKNTEKLIEDLESFEDPYVKYEQEKEKEKKELEELRKKRDEEKDPDTKRKIDTEISTKIFQSHFFANSDAIKKAKYERSVAIADVLRKQNNTGTQVVAGKSTIKGVYENLNKVFGGVIGKNISTDDAPNVQALRGRAYYSSTRNLFKVERGADFGDVIHEYTHFLERNNPEMLKNSLAFAEYRTKGESVERLSKIMDSSGYSSDEIARKDNFFSPYCGKIYSASGDYKYARASEIMSMGVERLFKEPAKFAKEDREYFDFVVANLRGEL